MKNQWWIYVVVAAISALAGVAIAGLPNTVGSEATIVAPTTTVAPTSTIAPDEVTTTTEAVDDVVSTDVVSTEPTTEPATEPVETSTTVRATTTTTTDLPVDRADVVVVAINGAGVGGLAGRTRDELVDLGYDKARAADGTTIVDETTVYFFDGSEREAEEVSRDLDLDPSLIKPVILSPTFSALDGDQVTVYIGRDRS